MKSSFAKLLGASALLAIASFGVQAQELKIGFVNQDRVLSEAALSKSAEARKIELNKRQKEVEELAGKLRANAERFEKESPTLAEAERNRRQRDLVEQEREVQRRGRIFQEDLGQWKQEESANLAERARKVIKQISETEKIDVVLADAVYVHPRLDITDKVIKALGNSKGTP